MEKHKGFDLAWACDHEQHALDEHDRNTTGTYHILF